MLRDASQQPGADRWPESRQAEAVPTMFWQAPAPLAERLTAGTTPSGDVEAYVNEGRWLVDCPTCSGAQLASRTDRRFMCNECANFEVAGQWRRVIWPRDVAAIEKALELRFHRNAHWRPGETVADLVAENVEQGVS